MWHGSFGEGAWMMGFGFIPMLIFWGLLLFVVVSVVKWLAGSDAASPESPAGDDPSLEILKQRLAKGEIGQQEFDQLVERIRQVG